MLCVSLLRFAQLLADGCACSCWAGTVKQEKGRWGRRVQFQGASAAPALAASETRAPGHPLTPLARGHHLWAKVGFSAFSDHVLSQDLGKAAGAQQLVLGKGTLDYRGEGCPLLSSTRTPSLGRPAIMLWWPGACWEYHALRGLLIGEVIRGVCTVVVWLLDPCHLRAPLKGEGLQILVAAFCSLTRLQQLEGPLGIASWPTVRAGGTGTDWSCRLLFGRSFLESTQAAQGVPPTTTRYITDRDIRVGSAGGLGWRRVVPRSIEGNCTWRSEYPLLPCLMKTLCS